MMKAVNHTIICMRLSKLNLNLFGISINNNFNVQDSNEDKDRKNQANKKMYDELNTVADRLLNVYNKLFLEQMKANGKSSLVEQLKGQSWTPSTLTVIKNEIAKMESEEQNLTLEKNELLMKLQEQCTEMARLDVETVIFDNNKKRMSRADQRKQHIVRFVNGVSDAMIIAEIIWILMQFDMERMKKRFNFDTKLDKYRFDALICDRRLEILKTSLNIHHQKDDDILRIYCSSILELLNPNRKIRDVEFTIDHVIECIVGANEFKKHMFGLLERLSAEKQHSSENSPLLEKAVFNQNILLKFLNDGPVDKHQYWSVDYLKMKARLEEKLKAIRLEVAASKDESRFYIQKMNHDNLWSQKQFLWIWFLTEPKKVIKAIKLIKTVAQRKSSEPTARPLAGLLRKA